MTDTIRFLDYLTLRSAVTACVEQITQGSEHIKPLHRYFAMRLVLEGGFYPDEVTPHPPFRYEKRGKHHALLLDEAAGSNSEQTVLGGVKSKKIDVVVTKPAIGPVLALSFKATQNAFRNLTNRMEEAIGDCTNLHLRYPSLVYGFYHVILANRSSQIERHRLVREQNDVSIADDGTVMPTIRRYLLAMESLANRKTQWEDPSAYEGVAIHLVESAPTVVGRTYEPVAEESILSPVGFFDKLLRLYDDRYPYVTESISGITRAEWDWKSPLFADIVHRTGLELENALGYPVRIAA